MVNQFPLYYYDDWHWRKTLGSEWTCLLCKELLLIQPDHSPLMIFGSYKSISCLRALIHSIWCEYINPLQNIPLPFHAIFWSLLFYLLLRHQYGRLNIFFHNWGIKWCKVCFIHKYFIPSDKVFNSCCKFIFITILPLPLLLILLPRNDQFLAFFQIGIKNMSSSIAIFYAPVRGLEVH